MTKKSSLINHNKLITLFLILVLSTSAFMAILFIKIPIGGWGEKIRLALLSFGFFGYGFLLLSFLVHYLEKVNSWIRADKKRVIITVASLLAIGHAMFTALGANSWLSFFSTLAGDGVVIIGLQSADKLFDKWKKKKKSNKLK